MGIEMEGVLSSTARSMRCSLVLWIVSFMFLAGCGASKSQPINNQPLPPSQPTGVTVVPSSVTVTAGGVQQFTAIVTPSGANQAVTWSVSGTGCTGASCGTIDATGRYTAPATAPNPPTVTITTTTVADSTKSGSATVTVAPPPSPPAPAATLLIRDTPPAGVAVLSFSVTVTGAVLEPGDVSLVANPVSVEINRLLVETALPANLTIPSGTYTRLTVTFASPSLTILNNSGTGNGSCANGAICKLSPALAASSVNFTGQPFPITHDPSAPLVLELEFDLSKSLSDLGTISPVVTVRQLLPAELRQTGLSVKQVLGKIVEVFGDCCATGFSYTMVADTGSITIGDNSPSTQYVDAGNPACLDGFFCLQDKLAEADLTLTASCCVPTLANQAWVAKRVTVKSSDQTELEGVIAAVNGATQFDIVLLHQVPNVAGLELGDLVRMNLQSGPTIEAVDTDPRRNGLLFSAPSDLMVGQVVTARARSAPSGTPLAITTDRVRLKSGAFTARVKSILNSTDFVVVALPGIFPNAEIQVRTNAQTGFQGASGVAALNVGDTVSLSGFLLKTSGDPVLLPEGVLKR